MSNGSSKTMSFTAIYFKLGQKLLATNKLDAVQLSKICSLQ